MALSSVPTRRLAAVVAVLNACVPGAAALAQTGGSVAGDRAALEALYDATNGANWKTSTNWKTTAALSTWHGVTVDSSGRVTQVVMKGNDLAGALPSALGDLDRLEILNLDGNQLTGAIPAALGNLGELTTLAIGNNRLTGAIPTALGGASSLELLSFARNDLSGSIPSELGSLSSLERVYLSSNRLTGAIPSELANLTSLTHLELKFNHGLSGALPAGFANLSQLGIVDVRATSLCVPTGAAFQTWLAGRTFFGASGRLCGVDPPAQPVIDVAVFYTPLAAKNAGGTAAIETQIDLWVTQTNQAYADSGMAQRVALVAREEVPYIEAATTPEDLGRVRARGDGYMDRVHAVRDLVGADLVHLVTGRGTLGRPGVPRRNGGPGLCRDDPHRAPQGRPDLRPRDGPQHGSQPRPVRRLRARQLRRDRPLRLRFRLREPAGLRSGRGSGFPVAHDHVLGVAMHPQRCGLPATGALLQSGPEPGRPRPGRGGGRGRPGPPRPGARGARHGRVQPQCRRLQADGVALDCHAGPGGNARRPGDARERHGSHAGCRVRVHGSGRRHADLRRVVFSRHRGECAGDRVRGHRQPAGRRSGGDHRDGDRCSRFEHERLAAVPGGGQRGRRGRLRRR